MVPLLAPLLGSLAGSLLPATVGTGIAGALGLSGAAGGLVAAAAPKALGAGIGTLLAGGDLGDAALNAVGFGAAGALGGAGAAGAGTAGAAGAAGAAANAPLSAMGAGPAAAAPATATAGINTAANAAAAAPAAPAAPAAAPAMTPGQMMKTAGQVSSLMGGGQPAAAPAAPQIQQRPASRMQDNPMLAQMPGPSSMAPAAAPISSTMPASVGIGALPGIGQQMSSGAMTAGLGPNQQSAVNDYLRSQGMVGFA